MGRGVLLPWTPFLTEEVGDEVDTQVILVASGKFSSGFDEVPFNMLKLS